ncbi:uncharacterized protein DUF1761 [Roseivirga ehrenbergii]|uniref:DUF1761 domain-containing protein n=2 Tax=Roseivirga TaxID=290180 RepID=A0A0L8AKG7_9BACT|nr:MULTISPECIES: DUF1761 domain-containing protein [Roseivirga]KOF02884.1 hypothetical protein OB69_09770 [Roseivirga seohaensis subsp. aquiponti]KYG82148.1 hypothetical protein MB14_01760 [Roseivirga ehrenbergii]TCL01972.1 uncharacterized protein DUF1761 [Roseivirga ehrenbergii]
MDISNINWLAVVVSTVAYFALGAIWYGPLFGKAWQRGVGLSDEELKKANMGKLFGSALILSFVVSFGMAMFFYGFGENPDMDATMGGMMGLMTGLFFIIPSTALNYNFARKGVGLIMIDSLYHTIAFTIIGVILGVWK